MHKEIKKLTRSIFLVITAIVVALAILLWFITHSFMNIQLMPSDASLMIDGKMISVPDSGLVRNFISPGIHLIRIEAKGYIGLSQEINFKRGLPKKIVVTLNKTPEPFAISAGGKFLTKGNDFNDIYYQNGATIFRVRVKPDTDRKIKLAEERAVTNPVISQTNEIVWSSTKELALFRQSDFISLFDLKKYDFINQNENSWGESVGSIAWAPDNSKVAYYYAPTSGEKSLIFSNANNQEITRVLDFNEHGINNPVLHWSPDSEWLLIIPRNEDPQSNKIYIFNAYSRKISEIADTGNQLEAIFSPDGNKILYSTYSEDENGVVNSILSIMDKDGSNKKSLNIRAELKKTTWSKDSENIIVATYDEQTQQESIFKYDTKKRQQSGFIIKNLGEDVFVQNLVLTDDNNVIIYQDNQGVQAINVQ
jgi:hypothetical protein